MVKGLILFWSRVGSTFLAHCLDSHPEVYCTRSEILHNQHPAANTGLTNIEKVRLYLEPKGYEVRLAKVGFDQMDADLWDWIRKEDYKIIKLSRKNTIRVITSIYLKKDGNRFTSKSLIDKPTKITIQPDQLISVARKRLSKEKKAYRKLKSSGLDTLKLSYKDLVGGEHKTTDCVLWPATKQLCDFLGVERTTLCCDLKKINRWPLCEIYENWDEIREVIKDSELNYCLEDERHF